jgi:Phosphotransferase enzyme family
VSETDVAHPVARCVADLLTGGARRQPMSHTDSKSGAQFERVEMNGQNYVLKHLDLRDDWTMRAVGDLGCGTLRLWTAGLLDQLPACFRQPIMGVASDPSVWPPGQATSILMEDVGAFLVPPGDDPISLVQHLSFIDHMAALHAHFWEAGAIIDIIPPENRLLELSPWLPLAEGELGSIHLVPRLVGEGWELLGSVAPRLAEIVLPLAWDPSRLACALASTPTTLVHGNWKLGNLGTDDDGRTVLIDWENPGRGSGCAELAWYLAINAARLPCSREETIDTYRVSLEARGIATDGWWDRQIALGLLAGIVWFGWEKAFGGWGEELAWWTERAEDAVGHLP